MRILLPCLLMITVSLLCGQPTAYAAKADEARKAEIEAELKAKKAEHAALLKKEKEVSTEVTSIKSKLVETSTSLRKTEQTIAAGDQKLKTLQQQKDAHLQALFKDQDAMGGWLTAASRYNRSSLPQILVQRSPLDAARAALLMKSAIPQLQDHMGEIKTLLASLAVTESDIAAQREIQAKEYKKMADQKNELSGVLKERQDIYNETASARQAQEKEMDALAKEAKSLDDLLLKIKKKAKKENIAAAPLPSGMMSPVEGTIRTSFGGKTETGATSKGITFNAKPGASVVTPLAGTVRFAGPFQKYRQILIVEHRGGYHSLIAGLGRVDTVVGDKLSAGEPVGAADDGDTPAIYYELRQNGDPIDPKKMLTARR